MNEVIYGIAIVPLIIGLVQAVKTTGFLPDRFAPIVSLIFGLLFGIAMVANGNVDLLEGVFTGAAFGLSASGLYSGARAIGNG